MTYDNIIYFFDSYYLMIDYDETTEEIIQDFISTEREELVTDTVNEIKSAAEKKDDKILEYILEKSLVISATKEELLDMIVEINNEFQKVMKK